MDNFQVGEYYKYKMCGNGGTSYLKILEVDNKNINDCIHDSGISTITVYDSAGQEIDNGCFYINHGEQYLLPDRLGTFTKINKEEFVKQFIEVRRKVMALTQEIYEENVENV